MFRRSQPRASEAAAAPPRRRLWPRLVLVVFLLALAYTGAIFIRISRQAGMDETRAADAIVVFGAAQYVGRPSPVLKARLDHAFSLYERQLAPIIIVTGGKGDDRGHSEGGVGRDYLMGRGVPESQVIAETTGDNTLESARRVSRIMKTNRVHTCIAVSDDYHIFRIKQMMAREGITCYGAPRPQGKPPTRWQRNKLILREVVSYTAWLLRIT